MQRKQMAPLVQTDRVGVHSYAKKKHKVLHQPALGPVEIRIELEELGRGPDNQEDAQRQAQKEGIPFIDERAGLDPSVTFADDERADATWDYRAFPQSEGVKWDKELYEMNVETERKGREKLRYQRLLHLRRVGRI